MIEKLLGSQDVFALRYEAPDFVERGLIWGHFSCFVAGKQLGDYEDDVCISSLLSTFQTVIQDRRNRYDQTLFLSPPQTVFLYIQNLMWETPPPTGFSYPVPEIHAAFWFLNRLDVDTAPRTVAIDYQNETRILYSYDEGQRVEEATIPSDTFYNTLTEFWHDINGRWA